MPGPGPARGFRSRLLCHQATASYFFSIRDASQDSKFYNLIRVSPEGHCLWTAKLPADPDTFVAVRLEGDRLIAHTWSGFSLHLNPITGQTIEQEFVK